MCKSMARRDGWLRFEDEVNATAKASSSVFTSVKLLLVDAIPTRLTLYPLATKALLISIIIRN